ncbi:MAG: outer membrane beta-barrel protein [Bacteroidota bacterium]
MKKYFLTIVLLILTSAMFAQCPIAKGQTQLDAGLGFSSWGVPVYVGLDYGIAQDFTIGGELSFHSYSHDGTNSSIFGLSANGNYHFNRIMEIPNNWDFYAGLNLGFFNTYFSGLGLGVQIGGRYYFNSKWGVNLEFGGGNTASGGQFGVSFKL